MGSKSTVICLWKTTKVGMTHKLRIRETAYRIKQLVNSNVSHVYFIHFNTYFADVIYWRPRTEWYHFFPQFKRYSFLIILSCRTDILRGKYKFMLLSKIHFKAYSTTNYFSSAKEPRDFNTSVGTRELN